MKILCVIDSLGSGGAQRQIVELAKGFKENGHEVIFITYHAINFHKPDLDHNQIHVRTIIEPNYFKRLIKMRRAIRSYEPDAVLSFLEAASFMATLAGFPFRKWRLVVGERNAKPDIATSLKKRFYRFFHLLSDFVVSNSYSNLKLVFKANPLLKRNKTKVIYNIVDFEKFKKEHKIRFNKKTSIVVAASYFKKKNLDNLINAVSKLTPNLKEQLVIDWYGNISKGNLYYQENENKIKELGLGNVLFLNDQTNQITQKYLAADFVGLFSHYEGFPNTICEAMALGKPVIVSKVSDVPLFIKENTNGFLCDSKDVESIKNALIKAINATQAQRLEMGKKNYKTAIQTFNKKVIVDQYLKLLESEK